MTPINSPTNSAYVTQTTILLHGTDVSIEYTDEAILWYQPNAWPWDKLHRVCINMKLAEMTACGIPL